MKYFVLEFDHSTGKLVSMTQYDDDRQATTRWHELENLHSRDDTNTVEVMKMSATSVEALRAAAPQYFTWAAK